jgi:hypothetical protein
MVAAALIDRLVHHATMITLKRQELPPARARHQRRARRSGSVATQLRLNGGYRPDSVVHFRRLKVVHFSTPLDSAFRGLPLAAVAGLPLLAAACGGDSSRAHGRAKGSLRPAEDLVHVTVLQPPISYNGLRRTDQ